MLHRRGQAKTGCRDFEGAVEDLQRALGLLPRDQKTDLAAQIWCVLQDGVGVVAGKPVVFCPIVNACCAPREEQSSALSCCVLDSLPLLLHCRLRLRRPPRVITIDPTTPPPSSRWERCCCWEARAAM